MNNKGKTVIREPQLKRLRALAFIEGRLRGKTNAQVAAEYNVSEITVRRALTYAKKADLIVDAEDKILSDLVPSAIATVKDAIENGKNAKIALAVLQSTLPNFGKKTQPKGSSDSTTNELSDYIDKIRKEMVLDADRSTEAIEGAVLKSLPPATTGVDEEGLPDSIEPIPDSATPTPPASSRTQSDD